jgi:hypothetical protein
MCTRKGVADTGWATTRVLSASIIISVFLFGLILPGPVSPVRAEDNSIVTVLKDAAYGGLGGLLLGGVLALVVDKDSRDDSIRWGVVAGTFAGFAYGIYEVTRPDEYAGYPGSIGQPMASLTDTACPPLRLADVGARFRSTACLGLEDVRLAAAPAEKS